jgi:hypothetical protein
VAHLETHWEAGLSVQIKNICVQGICFFLPYSRLQAALQKQPSRIRYLRRLIVVILIAAQQMMASSTSKAQTDESPHYLAFEGYYHAKEGRWGPAIGWMLHAWDKLVEENVLPSPELAYDLALAYDHVPGRQLAAAYFYKTFLVMLPGSPRAIEVERRISTLLRDFQSMQLVKAQLLEKIFAHLLNLHREREKLYADSQDSYTIIFFRSENNAFSQIGEHIGTAYIGVGEIQSGLAAFDNFGTSARTNFHALTALVRAGQNNLASRYATDAKDLEGYHQRFEDNNDEIRKACSRMGGAMAWAKSSFESELKYGGGYWSKNSTEDMETAKGRQTLIDTIFEGKLPRVWSLQYLTKSIVELTEWRHRYRIMSQECRPESAEQKPAAVDPGTASFIKQVGDMWKDLELEVSARALFRFNRAKGHLKEFDTAEDWMQATSSDFEKISNYFHHELGLAVEVSGDQVSDIHYKHYSRGDLTLPMPRMPQGNESVDQRIERHVAVILKIYIDIFGNKHINEDEIRQTVAAVLARYPAPNISGVRDITVTRDRKTKVLRLPRVPLPNDMEKLKPGKTMGFMEDDPPYDEDKVASLVMDALDAGAGQLGKSMGFIAEIILNKGLTLERLAAFSYLQGLQISGAEFTEGRSADKDLTSRVLRAESPEWDKTLLGDAASSTTSMLRQRWATLKTNIGFLSDLNMVLQMVWLDEVDSPAYPVSKHQANDVAAALGAYYQIMGITVYRDWATSK